MPLYVKEIWSYLSCKYKAETQQNSGKHFRKRVFHGGRIEKVKKSKQKLKSSMKNRKKTPGWIEMYEPIVESSEEKRHTRQVGNCVIKFAEVGLMVRSYGTKRYFFFG